MNKILLTVLSSVATVMMVNIASAETLYDWRQDNQARRLNNGIQDGSLTAREAASLARGQVHVNNMERRFESDGVVTGREQYRLNRAQDRQSGRIYRKRHN